MRIVQLTPGAGNMFCGNCLRDNSLVKELRARGADVTMLPLYLPLTLDVPDQSAASPIFFGGISVYLEQKVPGFAHAPKWVREMLASRGLLKLAGGGAATTKPESLGDLTLSIVRGEEGRQAQELEELVTWLRSQPAPDIIILSNVMLAGLARRLKEIAPVVCTLQGEDFFLDALSSPFKEQVWRELAERAQDVALFIAPSAYFAELMQTRLGIPNSKLRVLANGLDLNGFTPPVERPSVPTVGYFARIAPEKGADDAVQAFIQLAQGGRVPGVRFRMGGSLGKGDEAFLQRLRDNVQRAGLTSRFEVCPNLERDEKIRFLQNCTIFSVPALYGEGFGLYLLEAWACGLPVVQPRHGAFPELVDATAGGVIVEPGNINALANAWAELLTNPIHARELGMRGLESVRARFTVEHMTTEFLKLLREHNLLRA